MERPGGCSGTKGFQRKIKIDHDALSPFVIDPIGSCTTGETLCGVGRRGPFNGLKGSPRRPLSGTRSIRPAFIIGSFAVDHNTYLTTGLKSLRFVDRQ